MRYPGMVDSVWREVAKEVGGQVCSLHCHVSQNWPVPHRLMVVNSAQ